MNETVNAGVWLVVKFGSDRNVQISNPGPSDRVGYLQPISEFKRQRFQENALLWFAESNLRGLMTYEVLKY